MQQHCAYDATYFTNTTSIYNYYYLHLIIYYVIITYDSWHAFNTLSFDALIIPEALLIH